MACVPSPAMTPALPSEWASNWTLSRMPVATSDNTPELPSQDLDAIRNEKAHPAIIMGKHALSESAGCALAMSDGDMSDVDDDLDEAEDFYSFISHSSQEDTDTTLLPGSLAVSGPPILASCKTSVADPASCLPSPICSVVSRGVQITDPTDTPGLREARVADARSLSGDKCDFAIKEVHHVQLGSRARRHASASAATLTQELEAGGDGLTDLTASGPAGSYVIHAGTEAALMSRKRVCHLGASMDQHLSATSDDDSYVRNQGGLMCKEEYSDVDDLSERSGYTADGVRARLSDTGCLSRESVHSVSHSSWHREQRRNGIENRPGALHSTSILHLTQPSGDGPWTLSLDPTRPSSNNLNVLSRQSSRATTASVTLSDESSIAFHSSQRHTMLSDDHLPAAPSYRQSPTARIRARYYNEDFETRPSPRYQQDTSEYSSPQAYSFPTMNSGSSSSPPTPVLPFIIYTHNDAPSHAKATGVVQKTKALCSKLKKLVTRSKDGARPLPSAVEHGYEYDPYLRRNAMDLAEHGVSPPLPYLGGRPSVSLNGHQGFQRTTKVSAVSVPVAHRVGHRRTDAVDVHRRYEPSIPDVKEVKDVKAGRRFSLPVFAGSTSGSSRSRRFSTFPSNKRPRLSMISAAHLV